MFLDLYPEESRGLRSGRFSTSTCQTFRVNAESYLPFFWIINHSQVSWKWESEKTLVLFQRLMLLLLPGSSFACCPSLMVTKRWREQKRKQQLQDLWALSALRLVSVTEWSQTNKEVQIKTKSRDNSPTPPPHPTPLQILFHTHTELRKASMLLSSNLIKKHCSEVEAL